MRKDIVAQTKHTLNLGVVLADELDDCMDEGWLKPGELVPIVLGNSNSALVSNVMRIENVPAD